MQIVNLYTLKVDRVPSYNRDCLIQTRLIDLRNAYPIDSDTIIDKSAIEHIEIPIRKYRWSNGKEVLAAFDSEVLELIGIDEESIKAKISMATMLAKTKQQASESKLKEMLDMSFWQRIKWAFKALKKG